MMIPNGLARLLRSVGLQFWLLSSVAEFFKAALPEGSICLVLDVRMPGQSGLDLQRELSHGTSRQRPIAFITGHGDIPMTVQAMKRGAIEFLTKPFRDQDLLDAMGSATRGIAVGWRMRKSCRSSNSLARGSDSRPS